jgi:hypothetical protein
VARKYKIPGIAAARGDTSTGKSGDAKSPSVGTAFPARMKKIHTPRRRLTVTFLNEQPAPIKMRQPGQNVGNVAAKLHAIQPQRV